jgi:hypothetical protein
MTRRLRRRDLVALLALLGLLLGACGNLEERSMCRQYEDVRAVAADLRALDPATATTTELLELLDEALVELDQLQATTEGLYDQTISTIRTNLLEFRQVTFDLGEETLEVVRPLYAESRDRTDTAYQLLEQRLDVVCNVG